MTHYTKEVEGMMNKFLDAEIKWVDIDNGLGKYMLASQVIEQAHKVFTEYQESHHQELQKAREEALTREKQLKQVHMMELDTISCMSLEQYVAWRDQRKQRPNHPELDQDVSK